MTAGSRPVGPWPVRESLYPTLELAAAVLPDQALGTLADVARRHGYRITHPAPGALRAVLGHRSWSLVAETVGLPPVRPFLHVELTATAVATPEGTVLRVTCGRGGQELGVATRVARLLDQVLTRLDAPGASARASDWVSAPPA